MASHYRDGVLDVVMSVYQDDMAEATVRLLYIENLGYLLLDAVGYMRAA
jgi:hypothetical protein